MINHIVLSGGAYLGLYELGCLKYLSQQKFYTIKNIKSIHGTSVGSFIGVILCLDIDWDIICEYFIDRPWHKTTTITPSMLFDIIPKKGLYDTDIINKALSPLFHSVNIDMNITLKEFYNITHIDLFLYTIPINTFDIISLSHYTHPDLSLMKSIQMSCALPFIFQPVEHENEFYIDGGLLNNYPLIDCLNRDDANVNNILSLKFEHKKTDDSIKKESNILEYGYFLYKKMIKKCKKSKTIIQNENEIIIPCDSTNLNDGFNIINDEIERKKYIEQGEIFAKIFLKYKEDLNS
jgi:predicted acylesterase/phospholipase RssA